MSSPPIRCGSAWYARPDLWCGVAVARKTRSHTRRPAGGRRQRGIALLTAVLAVALAVVLVAALLEAGANARARSAHVQRGEQAWQLLHGIEAWAIRALQDEQAAQPNVDSFGDAWAQPLPPIEVPGGRVGGRLRERGGCLNLNALLQEQDSHAADVARERLQRLLQVLRLDPNIAAAVRDWIDPDADPSPGGAEDLQYASAAPPHRAANRPFAHVSGLRLVRGVDADAFAVLQPHVCALPDPAARINLNTATPQLWMSLDARISEARARRLARDGQARYADLEAVRMELARELAIPVEQLDPTVLVGTAVQTDWFVLEAEVTLDGLPFLYSSLLHRGPGAPAVRGRVRGPW